MLMIDNIDAGYGDAKILRGISIEAKAGEITCLFGRNGAGKTTTMKAIMGLVDVDAGSVSLEGEVISTLPAHEVQAMC